VGARVRGLPSACRLRLVARCDQSASLVAGCESVCRRRIRLSGSPRDRPARYTDRAAEDYLAYKSHAQVAFLVAAAPPCPAVASPGAVQMSSRAARWTPNRRQGGGPLREDRVKRPAGARPLRDPPSREELFGTFSETLLLFGFIDQQVSTAPTGVRRLRRLPRRGATLSMRASPAERARRGGDSSVRNGDDGRTERGLNADSSLTFQRCPLWGAPLTHWLRRIASGDLAWNVGSSLGYSGSSAIRRSASCRPARPSPRPRNTGLRPNASPQRSAALTLHHLDESNPLTGNSCL
jgi:hypothetical protein